VICESKIAEGLGAQRSHCTIFKTWDEYNFDPSPENSTEPEPKVEVKIARELLIIPVVLSKSKTVRGGTIASFFPVGEIFAIKKFPDNVGPILEITGTSTKPAAVRR
jgi:hypothetical protein